MRKTRIVFTRKIGESICIGDDIVVSLCGVDLSGKAKIATTAPESVEVDRGEIRKMKNLRRSENAKTDKKKTG